VLSPIRAVAIGQCPRVLGLGNDDLLVELRGGARRRSPSIWEIVPWKKRCSRNRPITSKLHAAVTPGFWKKA